MADKKTVFLTGKFYWAKVLGRPTFNKFKDANEWSLEFEPDEEGVKVLKQHKLTDRLKDKYEDRGAFLTLRKPEFNAKGEPNKPIRVYNGEDEEWNQDQLIGNGSGGDIKLDIRDYGAGKKKGVYPVAIRVTDLVAYQSSEFGAMDKNEDEPKAAKPAAKKPAPDKDFDPEMDDDLPF